MFGRLGMFDPDSLEILEKCFPLNKGEIEGGLPLLKINDAGKAIWL